MRRNVDKLLYFLLIQKKFFKQNFYILILQENKKTFPRPMSSTGRPISGILRSEIHTQSRGGTLAETLRTSRTSQATRAASSSSARFTRFGTVLDYFSIAEKKNFFFFINLK